MLMLGPFDVVIISIKAIQDVSFKQIVVLKPLKIFVLVIFLLILAFWLPILFSVILLKFFCEDAIVAYEKLLAAGATG